jgi:hydroxyethylthiazole kinase-like uncharacterized protein yjeF
VARGRVAGHRRTVTAGRAARRRDAAGPVGLAAHRVADVRSAEATVMAQVPPGALMQQAAAGLAAECAHLLRERAGGVAGRRVVLLVGPGNNGGDALFAGVRLADRGARVTAVLLSPRSHADGLAALVAAGGRTVDAGAAGGVADAGSALAGADLVVDGIVGLGAGAGLRLPASALVSGVPAGVPVVAVDLPSGVDPDTGEAPGDHVRADVTVTFGTGKPCLLLPPAAAAAGRIRLVDIGLGPHLPAAPAVERLSPADAGRLWPAPDRAADKYRRGVLGVVAGSSAYPGAAVLVTAGAVRAGVGMVRYIGPDAAADAVRAAHPEVVAGQGRVQAWVLGSGVDPDAPDGQVGAVEHALASGEPCVIDAGALAAFAATVAAGPLADAGDRVLLTPHAGELARLLGALPDGSDAGTEPPRADVEAAPYPHAAAAAARTGATVLVKGATTLVVHPDGRARSQADGPPWLATAGAGDVLAGVAGALLAGGLGAYDAGAVATLVHGRAAARASSGGPIAAGDVAEALPATIRELLTATSW